MEKMRFFSDGEGSRVGGEVENKVGPVEHIESFLTGDNDVFVSGFLLFFFSLLVAKNTSKLLASVPPR